MTELNKLVRKIDELDEINKINEIIDTLNDGVSITVDTELNESSPNPVQNAVITTALQSKQDTLTAGTGISISEEGVISNTQTSAEWGNIQGDLSEQSDLTSVLDLKQDKSKMVTTVLSTSTDENYPSAKSVYDLIANAEYQLNVVSDTNERLVLDGMANQYDPSKFLPPNTHITVKLDGSGDFETIKEAFDYIKDKWSYGEIQISLGEGTHYIDETLVINDIKYPHIILMGTNINNTIIKPSVPNMTSLIAVTSKGVIATIANLTISGYDTGTSIGVGVVCEGGAHLYGYNIKFTNLQYGIWLGWESLGYLDTLVFDNLTQGIECQNFARLLLSGTLSMNKVNLGFHWVRISQICSTCTYSFSNVTTKVSQALNSYSVNGIFYTDNTF